MMYLLFFLASSAKCLAVGPSFVSAVFTCMGSSPLSGLTYWYPFRAISGNTSTSTFFSAAWSTYLSMIFVVAATSPHLAVIFTTAAFGPSWLVY